MTDENSNPVPGSDAVRHLKEMGMSTYAARTFVALSSIGKGTAKDISRVSDVPRTRVYDAVDELRKWGLVDVQNSNPKEFWCVSPETARRTFQQRYQHRVDELTNSLKEIRPDSLEEEQRGVWTVTGQEAVTERVNEFVASAEDEVIYMTVGELLTDDVLESLNDAVERDTDIKIGGVSEGVEDKIGNIAPEMGVFESAWEWSDTPAARLLLVDRRKTLVSVLTNEDHEDGEARTETAIWGSGKKNSLVVVVKALFMWRLDSPKS